MDTLTLLRRFREIVNHSDAPRRVFDLIPDIDKAIDRERTQRNVMGEPNDESAGFSTG